jgi:hypothetical protein
MTLFRLFGCLLVVGALVVAAVVGQTQEPAGVKMVSAADKFLSSLTPEQKEKAQFKFDDPERTDWNFVPLQDKEKKPLRKGLRLDQMTPVQRDAALSLVKTGTSNDGYIKATTIMNLEAVLRDLEKNGANARNPDWYFFSVFGTPQKTGKWGWRVEGHHLSLNFTIDNGKVQSATPAFFGANPAILRDGDRQGDAVLPDTQDIARLLANSLSDEQQKLAHRDKDFPEIDAKSTAPKVGDPEGLPVAKMNEKQKTLLMNLLESYAHRLVPEIADAQLRELRDAGVDKIHFAYSGKFEAGKPTTYRIQGPTFLVEFLNVQADGSNNPANHIHSAWRTIGGDFGMK